MKKDGGSRKEWEEEKKSHEVNYLHADSPLTQ